MFQRDAFSIPPAPLTLTMMGLMPFLGGTGALILMPAGAPQTVLTATILLAYSAAILSFLGGVRWGVEILAGVLRGTRWSVLILSVMGSLVAWAMAILAALYGPLAWMFVAMSAGLLAQWAWDVLAARDIPNWYSGLRTIASVGAITSLMVAAGILHFTG